MGAAEMAVSRDRHLVKLSVGARNVYHPLVVWVPERGGGLFAIPLRGQDSGEQCERLPGAGRRLQQGMPPSSECSCSVPHQQQLRDSGGFRHAGTM